MDPSIEMNGKLEIRRLERKVDSRGWLLKLLMRHHLENPESPFGEIYLTAATPGEVKGNHFHNDTIEWFCVIQGEGCLHAKDIETGEQYEVIMAADDPIIVRVPQKIAHAIENVGQDLMVLLAYADQPYDAADPDEVRTILREAKSQSEQL